MLKLTAILKKALLLLGSIWPSASRRIFVTILSRGNLTGPNRFLYNLEQAMVASGWAMERLFLGRCRAALVVTRAPGRWFYTLCRWRRIRTVVRADGFYVTDLFDGQPHEHRSTRSMNPERHAHNTGMREALERCDWVVYQSHFSKQQADRHLYRRDRSFSIIENGVDLSLFTPISQPEAAKRVIALGTWRDLDLVDVTLKAFRILATWDEHFRFDLAGTLSPQVEAVLADFLKGNPALSGRLTVHGAVQLEALPALLRTATVALQLKSGDWCPNAVLELLASGVPVICQEWGGTRELVGDAGAVISYPPYRYDAELARKAAEAAVRILDDSSAWTFRARRQAEKFDIHQVSERYLAVLTGDTAATPNS